MNLIKIVKELEAERDLLEEAVMTMRRLAANNGQRRRGRPPLWLQKKKPGSETAKAQAKTA